MRKILLLIASVSAHYWWKFAKKGEVRDYDELPLLGKMHYNVFIFSMNRLTKTKGADELAKWMDNVVTEMEREGC